MKKLILLLVLVFVLALAIAPAPAEAYTPACWGQATAVYAQMGVMGEHASQQPTPRDGLAYLAYALYDGGDGPLEEPTLPALGAWLNAELELGVEACEL